MRPLARVAFTFYQRMTSAAWDHVIVTDRHSAGAFTGRPTSVVPNYPLLLPVEQSAAGIRKSRTLIYVGEFIRISWSPGHARNRGLTPGPECGIAVDGAFTSSEDEKLIRAAPNIKFFGNQSVRTVYERIAEADLGLLLLQPVPAYTYAGENTLKLFEYMWGALPVVSSDFPNLRRIIEGAQCGICTDPCNPTHAASAIMHLLEHPELRQEMGKNGRNAVLRAYNWPAASKVLSQVYKNVLSSNRSSVEPLPFWNVETA